MFSKGCNHIQDFMNVSLWTICAMLVITMIRSFIGSHECSAKLKLTQGEGSSESTILFQRQPDFDELVINSQLKTVCEKWWKSTLIALY